MISWTIGETVVTQLVGETNSIGQTVSVQLGNIPAMPSGRRFSRFEDFDTSGVKIMNLGNKLLSKLKSSKFLNVII